MFKVVNGVVSTIEHSMAKLKSISSDNKDEDSKPDFRQLKALSKNGYMLVL